MGKYKENIKEDIPWAWSCKNQKKGAWSYKKKKTFCDFAGISPFEPSHHSLEIQRLGKVA